VTAQLLVDAKVKLDQCVLKCETSNSLYWTDIEGFTMSCWHAVDGRVQQWTLPQRVGSFALCHGTSQLLLGLASGIAVYPDGSTVDADGGLWNAQWHGGCIARYDPAGLESPRFAIPASQRTWVAFGGALLDQIYATSARTGLSDKALGMEPQSGGVFVWQPGWQGLPGHRFSCAQEPGPA
jgi:sugar lactone lactonase YvrE